MATFTTHYQLHQWVPEDDFLRTDFNADFAKIDAALGEKADQTALSAVQALAEGRCRIVYGQYTGDGNSNQTINLGFRPKLVVAVANGTGGTSNSATALEGASSGNAEIVDGGFEASGSSVSGGMNVNTRIYYYCAFL